MIKVIDRFGQQNALLIVRSTLLVPNHIILGWTI